MGHLLIQGNSKSIPLAAGSVHCVCTSPPYFGLRSYLPKDSKVKHLEMGLERSVESYVAGMVEVFRDVHRVLRDDGTAWLNLGDTFASTSKGSGGTGKSGLLKDGRPEAQRLITADAANARAKFDVRKFDLSDGIKPKDLLGIPWRVALALQADGWYLRRDIIWSKLNPMPESVTDRPSSAHEYIFLLAKSSTYFYDAEAIKEPLAAASAERYAYEFGGNKNSALVAADKDGMGVRTRVIGDRDVPDSRNKRSVWECPTQPTPEAHFATWPRRLVEPMVKAGTSEMGCCSACGTPWRRVVEKKRRATRPGLDTKTAGLGSAEFGNRDPGRHVTTTRTKGWVPGCPCGKGLVPVPPVVFDPFCGSGTTLEVARLLGRYAIGMDLNAKYLRSIARKRARRGERPHENEAVRPRIVPLPGQMSFLEPAGA